MKKRSIDDAASRIRLHDAWVNRIDEMKPPLDELKEFQLLFAENPEAYQFYRHALFYRACQIDGTVKMVDQLMELIGEAFVKYPVEAKKAWDKLKAEDFSRKYNLSRKNMIATSDTLPPRLLSQQGCFLYQHYYELNALYVALATFGEILQSGYVDVTLRNLSDKNGKLKKGVAIDYILARIKNYPNLYQAFQTAYRHDLRNTVGHNEYVLLKDRITSLDGSLTITAPEFTQSVYGMQQLDNALIYAMNSRDYESAKPDLSSCGLLGIGFGVDPQTSEAVLAVYQLWCFYEIDKKLTWVRSIDFTLQDNKLVTQVSKTGQQVGLYDWGVQAWLDKLSQQQSLPIQWSPVRPLSPEPKMVMEFDAGRFQMAEGGIEINVPFIINDSSKQ